MTNGSTASLQNEATANSATQVGETALSSPLQQLYHPVREELAQVEVMLAAELRSDAPFVDDLVRHAGRLSGKRLRPALLLLAGKACGSLEPAHIVLATVVEMIHTATLIHDDVLDEADLRRHQETVNARWSNEASVLLGDYLFSHSFYLASTLENTFACQSIGRSTNIVCRGEMLQVANRSNFNLSEDDYFEIIDAKTAELTACCCLLGACYSGAEIELRDRLEQYGRYLGLAFQIADDLLDVCGDEDSMGKSLGTDFEKSKPTLPLIRLLSTGNATERAEIEALLQLPAARRREALLRRLEESEAIQYARERAQSFADQARRLVADLPLGEAQQTLLHLPDFVLARQQ
ncbi:MAG: polyprenyl synthetase family protein [Planctomycetota bacterium]|nr:MAG: polyprenyl synthetase family protein [Planctomycetota bacterium]REJ88023.1 MAG: polyprenyl synthetase family protein [Planctomycetota bacterium]REK29954.1 MAG: polyprenyl synthetase family protein [Planctomycetota bacterium]REK47876.1 MAG: polyprenyl synthetase family protein [Planctomycetota bacterium]